MIRKLDLPWRWSRQERKEFLKGLLFISPWIIGFLAFTTYPILASIYYSFTRYDILRPPIFLGIENYQRILTEDKDFRQAVYNTVYYVVFAVPLGIVTAFLLASLLNNKIAFRPMFRTIFFIPSIVPVVASAMVWLWIYNPQYGLINGFLASQGFKAIPWLSSPKWAKPSLIIIHCWAVGGNMLIFLAALQDVPASLYDAAKVDGAHRLHRFWHITIPMCTPAILFTLLTGLIGAFQYFTFAWILTQGGPNRATEFYSVYLYRNAFVFFKMGYASALAWILFIIIVAVTVLLFRTSARWVYYGGAE